ncbi:MAG: AtpZ/AtpI family protein [Acidobacteriia bacterium]|nr:AtpZ/AtpI family protein [Terriglobia bacterium]
MASQGSEPGKRPGSVARQFALATELPFLLVGGVVAGGFLGYLLDRWWHTKPVLMILLGAVGFFVSLRDLLRRLQKDDPDIPTKSGP